VAEGLYFPNGAMVTPDGRTLIVCETLGNRISAFDIGADGTLGPRRDWAVFGPLPADPTLHAVFGNIAVAADGAVLDAEGAVWCADAARHRVLRVAEGGRILQEISTGAMGVFACTLGGPDRRTLYLCMAPDSLEVRRAPVREAALWTLTVDVPGAGWPC
jgi:sugar lactone lactonase YvrE